MCFLPTQSVNSKVWAVFCSFLSQAPSTRPGTQYIGPQLVFVERVSKRECRNSGLGSAGGSIDTSPTELQEPGKASREEERKLML